MFSATMPKKIQQLAATILTEPREVKIAVSKPADKIDQSVYICHEGQKEGLLRHIFEGGNNKRVIIFSSSKQKVKELTQVLRRNRYKAAEMHSDLDQKQREEVMLAFRAGRIDILVATDILARGIDIDEIAMVINYDVPHEAEDYVHRIGRTARADADGRAITFVSERDQLRWKLIEDFLEKEVRRGEIPADLGEGPAYNPASRNRNGRGPKGRNSKGKSNNHPRNRKERQDGKQKTSKATDTPKTQQTEDTVKAQKKEKAPGKPRHRRRPSKPAENKE